MSKQPKLQRPWNPAGSAHESTYTDNVKGGVEHSDSGVVYAKNLFDKFGLIYDQMVIASNAYGGAAAGVGIGAKPNTLHERIDTIRQFGKLVLGHHAPGMAAANITNHNNAVRQVLQLLRECVADANGLVGYLQTSCAHVDAIVSTFD